MAKLQRPTVNGTTDQRQRAHEFRVTVALDDLGRNSVGLQAEFPADVMLNLRVHVRVRADRAGNLADRHRVAGAFQPGQRPGKFVVHQRHLQPERDRLGVDAVRAPDHRREFVFLAFFATTARNFFTSSIRMSADCIICTANAVSTTSDDVSPSWM